MQLFQNSKNIDTETKNIERKKQTHFQIQWKKYK